MKQPIFPPKDSTARIKNTKVLHIQSLFLMVVLTMSLSASLGILARSILAVFLPDMISTNEITDLLSEGGYMDALTYDPTSSPIFVLFKVWGVIGYVVAFVTLAAAIVLLIFMKKRIAMILEDAPAEKTIRVKKAKYVWLGFLLGGFGAHFFAIQSKDKATMFLIFGIVGTLLLPILFLYTSAISFSDAFLACFIPKDAEGFIEVEDYPYWI